MVPTGHHSAPWASMCTKHSMDILPQCEHDERDAPVSCWSGQVGKSQESLNATLASRVHIEQETLTQHADTGGRFDPGRLAIKSD